MAHRAPNPKGCLLGAAPFVVGGLLLALCGALAGCDPDDIGPAQRPVDRPRVTEAPPELRSWQPARPGDLCSPSGARLRSNTGVELTCGRHRGLGYDTWG